MKGVRKYRAFWGALVAATAVVIVAIAVQPEGAVDIVKAFASMLPLLLGAFGLANVGEHFTNGREKNA